MLAATLPEHLIDATKQYLEQRVEVYLQQSAIEARYSVEVSRLDPRLQLTDCDEALTAKLAPPATPVGRVTVRVSCEDRKSWSIFIPAQVHLFRNVVVATQPLPRGTLLKESDVGLVERDTGLLTQGYMTDLSQVIGNKLTRPLIADQILLPAALVQPNTIRKGDHVIISASGDGMSVRMLGEALSGGSSGQQIRIKNLSSGRTLKAVITGPGQVEVNL